MDRAPSSVIGLSTLRPKDEPKKPKETDEARRKKASLNAYLSAAYGSLEGTGEKKKKKKGKKRVKKSGGIAIVDADIDTSVPVGEVSGGKKQECEDEDAPVIVNEGEFRRLQVQEDRQKELAEREGGWKVVDEGGGSPPGCARHDTDEDDDPSPPRRVRHDSDDESSQEHSDADVPRRKPEDSKPDQMGREDGIDDNDKGNNSDVDVPRRGPYRMSDGSLAGMVTGQELMKEMSEKRERDIEKFRNLDDSVTGRQAKTVYRMEDGRAVSKEAFEQEARDKRQREKGYVDGADLPWGRGLRQTMGEARDARQEESKQSLPSRWDDPMGHILAKKKSGAKPRGKSLLDAHAKELRKAGFNVPLEVPPHSWLNRNIAAPPNRFNIAPGRHWDGVERGQGFESWRTKTLAAKAARVQLGHMMTQEDM
mmetsp:Transcript_12211/g.34694  ORF Transcript_12211/g.34694 Transcript_12211/m.34694 type:complete len:423 (-) Transcript_12211:22-1290(-)